MSDDKIHKVNRVITAQELMEEVKEKKFAPFWPIWPTEEEAKRMAPIAQNGNTGEHYDK